MKEFLKGLLKNIFIGAMLFLVIVFGIEGVKYSWKSMGGYGLGAFLTFLYAIANTFYCKYENIRKGKEESKIDKEKNVNDKEAERIEKIEL